MAIGTFGEGGTKLRFAQSPKSKVLHFEAKLCVKSNGNSTQPADREFDNLHNRARNLIDAGFEPSEAISKEIYKIGTASYLNIFRYFAKVLCCQLAGSGAPRPVHLSKFAIGGRDQNCVWLEIKRD